MSATFTTTFHDLTVLFNYNLSPFHPLCNIFQKSAGTAIMSFSSLVQDLSFKDNANERRAGNRGTSSTSTVDDRRSQVSRAMSYASTTATSVSISGDISSQLHGGYCHPLARSWQAERQLTKVRRHSHCFQYFTSS